MLPVLFIGRRHHHHHHRHHRFQRLNKGWRQPRPGIITVLSIYFHSFIHSFIHFWHAPVWVRSAKRRHHSPEWTILSYVNSFVQGEVQWFQVLLGSLHPRIVWGRPGGLLQFSKGRAIKVCCFASDSSGICAFVWHALAVLFEILYKIQGGPKKVSQIIFAITLSTASQFP